MSKATIDQLEIQIESSSSNAAKQISGLASALKKLGHAANSVKLGGLKKELGKLNGNEFSKIDRLVTSLKGLKGVNISSKLADNLLDFAAAVDLIDDNAIARIERLTNALSKLQGVNLKGFSTSSRAIGNDKSVNLFKDMTAEQAAAMDKTDLLKNKIEALKASLQAKIDAGVVNDQDIADASLKIQKLTEQYDKLESAKRKAFEASDEQDDPKVSAQGDETAQKYRNLKYIVSQTANALKENLNIVKQIANAFDRVKTAIASGVNPVAAVFTALLTSAVKLAVNLVRTLAKIGSSVLKGIVNLFKKIASAIGSAVKGLAKFSLTLVKLTPKLLGLDKIADGFNKIKNTIDSFKRIAFYRIIRSMIKMITDTLQEGAENAYWYSRKFGDATKYIADAMDAMTSSSYTLGNQLGAAWNTLLAAIQPIIMQIIAVVQRAVEVVTQFFAVLSGKTTYLKAVNYTKAWAEEAEEGSEAAKEWKNQLMGFDELNRLEEPSSGGSGKGSGLPDYGSMFEEVPVDSWFRDLLDMLKSDQWGKIGKKLGDKFNELISGFDWKGWGQKIGKGIQKGIDIAYNFLKTADFRNLGSSIVDFFDNVGKEIDFRSLGRLIVSIKTALWDVLVGAVASLGQEGKAKALANRLSDLIIGAMWELTNWINSLPTDDIANAIKGFFEGIKTSQIRSAFVLLVKTAWNEAVELADLIFDDETRGKIKGKLQEFFQKLKWEDIRTIITTKWSEMMSKVDEIWPPDSRKAFGEEVASDIKTLFSDLVFPAVKEIGSGIANALWEGITESEAFKNISKVWEALEAFLSPTTYNLKNLLDLFSGVGENSADGYKDGFNTQMDADITDMLSRFDNFVKDTETNLGIASPSTVFAEIGKNTAQGFSDGFTEIWDTFISWIETEWETLKSWWGNLKLPRIHLDLPHISVSGSFSLNPLRVPHFSLSWSSFANGGFPEEGPFFMNHGEIAGKFSNGKTAVANNEQITEGIADAVYAAFSRAFAETAGGGNDDDRTMNIYIGNELVYTGYAKWNKRQQLITGGRA